MNSRILNVESVKASTSRRVVWADLCRVVATFGVVIIHSCAAAFYQFTTLPMTDWLSVNFMDSLVRPSVPLFIMLSGALLLKRKEDVTLPDVFFRISKVFLPLLIWSAIYLLRNSYFNGIAVDWWSVFRYPAMYHLSFVYILFGIYLLIPIFQIIFNAILERIDLKIYLFVLWVIINSLPIYQPMPLLSLIQLNSFFGFGGYFLLGGIIAATTTERFASITWFYLYLIGALITFGLTFWFSQKANAPIETAYEYLSPNLVIESIAAFVLFTRATISLKIAKLLAFIADKSFLIFFIHVIVLEYIKYSSFIAFFSQHISTIFVILIMAVLTFVMSLLTASLIRFLPGRAFG